MLALIALIPALALVSAGPSRLNQRDASTSDWLCQQDGRGSAALVTANGSSFCGCTGDVPIGAAGLSVEYCIQVATNGMTDAYQNVCVDSRTGPYCATNCAYGFDRNPGDGNCVKTLPVSTTSSSSSSTSTLSSSSATTSAPSSHYCGYGTGNDGRCNPPPYSTTSYSTTFYCNGGPCNSQTTSKPSYSTTTYHTTFYCNGGPCNSSPTVPPHSRSSSASASSTSSASISSITGAAPRRLVASGSALIGAVAIVGFVL